MKRITCTLCGGTGIAYEVPDPVEVPKQKVIPAIEKQLSFDFGATSEEEDAWKHLERTTHTAIFSRSGPRLYRSVSKLPNESSTSQESQCRIT